MDSATCATSYAGAIRYNAGSVQLCNGTTWGSLGADVTSASVVSALGYTPAASGSGSSQWTTSSTTISYTGKVGIGLTDPTTPLQVAGPSNATPSIANSIFSTKSSISTGIFMGSYNAMPFGSWIQSADHVGMFPYPLILNPQGANVGIGLSNPLSRLVVKGLGTTSATSSLNVTNSSNNSHLFVRGDGNVGIGTSTPVDKLQIYDGSIRLGSSTDTNSSQGILKFGSASYPDGYAGVEGIAKGSPDRMELAFKTAYGSAVEAMRISEYGSVGIGTSSPLSILTVTGARQSATIKNTISTFDSQAFNSDVGAGIGMGGKINASGTMAHFGLVGARKENNISDDISGYLVFETRPVGGSLSEKMRINSVGNLGLGTTTPATLVDLYAAASPTLRIRSISNDPAGGPTIRLVEDLSENGGLIRYNALTNNLDLGVIESGVDNTRISMNRTTGNVGIGTTAPFVMLDVTSGAIRSTRQNYGNVQYLEIYSGDNILTAPHVRANSDESNKKPLYLQSFHDSTGGAAGSLGFFFQLGVASAPTDVFTIRETGNVGIGTTAPSFPIDIHTSNAFTARYVHASNNQYDGPAIMMVRARNTTASHTQVLSGDVMGGMYFRAFDGTSANTSTAAIEVSAAQNQTTSARGNFMIFETTQSGTNTRAERMRISSTGNVGIGSTSPNALLQIGPDGSTPSAYLTYSGSYLSSAGQAQYAGNWASAGYWGIGPATNGGDNTLRLGRIDSAAGTWSATQVTNLLIGGNLGIGQTSPTNALDILRTSGDLGVRLKADSGDSDVTIHLQNDVQTWKMINKAGFSDAFVIEDTTGGKTPFAIRKANGFIGMGGVTVPGYQLEVSGTVQITSGSALRIGATNICTSAGCVSSSDLRLKENIQPLDFSLEKLLSLNGVQYDWKNKTVYGDQHQIGFIAQELEKVFPEVVYTDKETGLKTVSYGQLLAPVVEAIKALFGKTQDNTRAIASLEEKDSAKDKQIKALMLENERKDKELREMKERLDRIEKALAR